MARKSLRPEIEAAVLVRSRRRCALCFGLKQDSEEKVGQIAHADGCPANNAIENLVFLCLEHHNFYDSRTSQSKGYTKKELLHYREELYSAIGGDRKMTVGDATSPGPSSPIWPNWPAFHMEALEDLRSEVRAHVAGGFMDEAAIAEAAVHYLSGDYDPESLRPYAAWMTERLMDEHLTQQKYWPEVTDCDRLEIAFDELERSGIACRQNYSCCMSCGYREIEEEITRLGSGHIRGYCFYHTQDIKAAAECNYLFLCYGSIQGGEEGAISIGREVASGLQRRGFEVSWDETWAKRIGFKIDWKRRR